MESKAYEYMDWPRIEAIVYGEEASPKDVMAPRLTTDGVLVQGFFPEADKAEVLVGSRKYEMEKEDEAGYFAAMIPGRKIPEYEYRVTRGEEVQEFSDPYAFAGQITEAEEKAFCAGVYYHSFHTSTISNSSFALSLIMRWNSGRSAVFADNARSIYVPTMAILLRSAYSRHSRS